MLEMLKGNCVAWQHRLHQLVAFVYVTICICCINNQQKMPNALDQVSIFENHLGIPGLLQVPY